VQQQVWHRCERSLYGLYNTSQSRRHRRQRRTLISQPAHLLGPAKVAVPRRTQTDDGAR
jgi:hypothetical protein